MVQQRDVHQVRRPQRTQLPRQPGLTGRTLTLTVGKGGLVQLDPPSQDRAPTGTRIGPPKPRGAPPLILRPDAGYIPNIVSSSPVVGEPV